MVKEKKKKKDKKKKKNKKVKVEKRKIAIIHHDRRNWAIAELKTNKEGEQIYVPDAYYFSIRAAMHSYQERLLRNSFVGVELDTDKIIKAIDEAKKETLSMLQELKLIERDKED